MRQHQFLRLARVRSTLVRSGVLSCVLACVLSGAPAGAQAVELGDALVRSHLGQPLSADIELTGIANEAAMLQASMADAEVYRSASIAFHPALAALSMTLVRRDGKRFLHLTSPTLVESEFVHLFFELNENGRRVVRQATLWFTPDPRPAPLAVAVAAAVVPLVAAQLVVAQRKAMAPMMAPAARPAACVQQFTAAQIGTCAALDANNAALGAQIVELEEKVRRLTAAVQAGAVTPVAPVVPVARVVPTAPPQVLAPMGAPVRTPAGATPWLFIGVASAAVFGLVGVMLFLLQRKRKAARLIPVARSGRSLIASVRDRLLPGRKGAETPAAAEPTAE